MELGLGDDLKLVSQTAYARDRYYSSQDYNRFVSAPVFNDSAVLVQNPSGAPRPVTVPGPTPGGIFTDPQLGRSEEHTSELQSLMRISYAVFCLKKKTT